MVSEWLLASIHILDEFFIYEQSIKNQSTA